MSERAASSGENSTSPQRSRAKATMRRAVSTTCARVMRSLYSRWMSDVAMKVWMRGCAAGAMAEAQRSMSPSFARARPQITGAFSPCPISSAMACTASQSPREAAGKPASMMSTPNRCSCRAICSFSSRVIVQPGACSPSRNVVSKMRTWSPVPVIRASVDATTPSLLMPPPGPGVLPWGSGTASCDAAQRPHARSGARCPSAAHS